MINPVIILHIGVECKVLCGVSDREIVARQLGLGHVEGHLVTS